MTTAAPGTTERRGSLGTYRTPTGTYSHLMELAQGLDRQASGRTLIDANLSRADLFGARLTRATPLIRKLFGVPLRRVR